jgi:hypothetical protein
MKLALRIAGVVCLALAGWWWFARTSGSSAVSAVEPVAKETAAKPEVAPDELAAASEQTHVEVPSAEDSRAAAQTPEPAVVTTETKPPTTGLLRVHVVARETRKPLAGQRIRVLPKGLEHWSWKDIEGPHAAVREAPLTDADGRAEIEMEAGHELRVSVGDDGARELTLAALAVGETRDVDIDVPTEADLTLFGRLVDAETKLAIGGGAVWCPDNSGFIEMGTHRVDFSANTEGAIPSDAIRAHPDGTFEMHVRSWEEKFANTKADGYSRVVFAIDASHATPESALEVRLSRAATLEVVVLDGGRAAANADVVLTTESYRLQQRESLLHFYATGDPRWTAQADAGGRAEVVDLPPRVPLELSVRAGATIRTEGERLTLDPGEHRKVEIALGSGASIVGRVETSAGAPLASCPMWLVASDGSQARLLRDYETPIATTTADAQGRFHFDDVAAGAWLVGPKPESRRRGEPKTDDAFAPLAQRVVIDASSRQVEVVVRVDIGLYLSGTVLDPTGTPVARMNVSASSAGTRVNENADQDGRFKLGPVPAGSYTLEAGSMRGAFAKSESVKANAGDADIVLRLRVGGVIRGRVVDATHQQRECELTLARADEEYGMMMTTSRDGALDFTGLLPGTYTVGAKTSDGLCGRSSGLVVRAGETIDNVEVVLEPGAHLKLRYDGTERYGQYQLFIGGTAHSADGLERGKDQVVVVPAGEIEVRWNARDPKTMHSQKVTLRAGEEREVVWDGKP